MISQLSCLFLLSCSAYGASSPDVEAAPFFGHSDESHQVEIINDGTLALKSRLEMIENAEKILNLEYFIFDTDLSGRLVLQALQKRASDQTRPIEIHLLVDYHFAKEGIDPWVARQLKESGIQVRYFNPGRVANFVKYNHRDHRKLIIADNRDGKLGFCTGGRNIADDYFDLQSKTSYTDRDVCIVGPISQVANDSFTQYWNSELSRDPSLLYKDNPGKENDAKDLFQVNDGDIALRQKVESAIASREPRSTIEVHSIDFITDVPERAHGSRVLQSHIESFVENTKQSLRIDNYNYMPKKSLSKKIQDLLNSGKEVSILSNAPESDPGEKVIKLQLGSEKSAVRAGAVVYLDTGEQLKDQLDLNQEAHLNQPVLWSEHAKVSVRDHLDSELGTYNFDRRSAGINSEDIVIIYGSTEVAGLIEKDIDSRIEVAHQLGSDGHYVDGGQPYLVGPGFHGFVEKMSLSFFKLIRSQY